MFLRILKRWLHHSHYRLILPICLFLSLIYPFTTLQHIFELHDLPTVIIFDHDLIFASTLVFPKLMLRHNVLTVLRRTPIMLHVALQK
jgi:hypothetical protein